MTHFPKKTKLQNENIGAGLAAASLLGGRGGSRGYGRGQRYNRFRGRRSGNNGKGIQRNEAAFEMLKEADSVDDCGKLYLCHLASFEVETKMNEVERDLFLALKPPQGAIRLDSVSSVFEAAIELGVNYKNKTKCSQRYSNCVSNKLRFD